MARVLRAVSTERGRMIGDYTLVAFGGSGGLHAASLAEAVGIARVVVPPLAGVLSAVGLLQAPVELSVTETVGLEVTDDSVPTIAALIDRLAAEQRSELDRIVKTVPALDEPAGGRGDETEVVVDLDVRYPGEASELTLALPGTTFDAAGAVELVTRFHSRHLAEYGHGEAGAVEVVRVRVTARRPQHDGGSALQAVPTTGSLAIGGTRRTAHFGAGPQQVPVVERAGLQTPTAGPLLVDEADTTTVVPPGWTAHRDTVGNLVLEARP
jgi:N-methylhydantoinase A